MSISKLIFLCGSFEAGRDGVGDYTRILASELKHRGFEVGIIAINDKAVTEIVDTIDSSPAELPVLRLPVTLSSRMRFDYAKKWLSAFNPEVISLQFVPFSFNAKGLPFELRHQLKKIGEGRTWHIMFHELWVGMEANSNLKMILWGKLQKLIIRSLVKTLNPASIHTQTRLYQVQIEKLGINAIYLPLFSNIPVAIDNEHSIETYDKTESAKQISFVLFGGIHPGAPLSQFIDDAVEYSIKNKTHLKLKLVGRTGPETQHWINSWKAASLEVEHIGEQSPFQISTILKNSSFGISTTPLPLLEKSGAVAAMREHNLPILCVAKSWRTRRNEAVRNALDVYEYKKGQLEEILGHRRSLQRPLTLREISQCFVETLT